MADFRIVVTIDPTRAQRGSDRVRRQLDRIGSAADRTRGRVRTATTQIGRRLDGVGVVAERTRGRVLGLNSAVAAIGGVFVVGRLAAIADGYTNIQNRLRLLTASQEELADVTERLFQISNRTRSSFEGTAELYARLGLSARELGVSQDQLLNFTESLNQAIILSGATGAEAQAGLIQFSQGLASGALRGDELRSVLEQLPAVADVISQHLGVTRGALREMGAEGRLTAGIILDAFAAAREELGDRFATTVPTLSQAFTVLRNEFTEFLGTQDTALGITRNLSAAILALSRNLDVLFAAAVAVSGVFIGRFAAGIATSITGMIAMARQASIARVALGVLGGPIGIITTALTVGASAWYLWGDAAEESSSEAVDSVNRVLESLRRQESGLSPEQFDITRGQERLNELLERRLELENIIGSRSRRQAIRIGFGAEVGELERVRAEIDQLEPALDRGQPSNCSDWTDDGRNGEVSRLQSLESFLSPLSRRSGEKSGV